MRILLALSVAFLIFGIILSVYGPALYLDYTAQGPKQPMGSSGFTFKTYPYHEHQMTGFGFVLSINPTTRTFYLDLRFVCYEQGEYRIAAFTPYQILTLEVLAPFREPNPVNWTFWNSGNGSIILASFKIDQNETYSHESRAKFEVSNPVVLSNYGDYTLDLPLGTHYSFDLQQLEDALSLRVGSGLNVTGQLQIFLPTSAILTQKSHDINERRFYGENQNLEILLDEYEDVLVRYTVPEEANEFQNKLFSSALFTGLGVPLILQSIYQLASRNKAPKKTGQGEEKVTDKNQTKAKNQLLSASDLDKVFDVALVLVGVLAAAVLQYSTAIDTSAEAKLFYFRVTTVPFLGLIPVWIFKEIGLRLVGKLKVTMFATLLCWTFWSNILLTFMFSFYSLSVPLQPDEINNAVLVILMLISLILTIMVDLAYYKSDLGGIAKEFKENRALFWVEVMLTLAISFIATSLILLWGFSAFL